MYLLDRIEININWNIFPNFFLHSSLRSFAPSFRVCAHVSFCFFYCCKFIAVCDKQSFKINMYALILHNLIRMFVCLFLFKPFRIRVFFWHRFVFTFLAQSEHVFYSINNITIWWKGTRQLIDDFQSFSSSEIGSCGNGTSKHSRILYAIHLVAHCIASQWLLEWRDMEMRVGDWTINYFLVC